MPSAAPVIARNLFLICHLVALWNERHGAPTWLMSGCAGKWLSEPGYATAEPQEKKPPGKWVTGRLIGMPPVRAGKPRRASIKFANCLGARPPAL
jgi:hypothetical protein